MWMLETKIISLQEQQVLLTKYYQLSYILRQDLVLNFFIFFLYVYLCECVYVCRRVCRCHKMGFNSLRDGVTDICGLSDLGVRFSVI